MFTGLVEGIGTLIGLEQQGSGLALRLDLGGLAESTSIGDSIAVSGCCLTIIRREGSVVTFEAGSETLSRTILGGLAPGHHVNIERSLRVGDRLGGHFVTGHVDGLGTLTKRREDGPWAYLHFQASRPLMQQMASKGSITVDGVSLTLVDVSESEFSVALIPHTLAVTTLGERREGDRVNLETDLLAKYVQRLVSFSDTSPHE